MKEKWEFAKLTQSKFSRINSWNSFSLLNKNQQIDFLYLFSAKYENNFPLAFSKKKTSWRRNKIPQRKNSDNEKIKTIEISNKLIPQGKKSFAANNST